MTAFDAGFIVLAGVAAWLGWRRGLVATGFAVVGFIGLGAFVAHLVHVPSSVTMIDPMSVLAAMAVAAGALAGWAVAAAVGGMVRRRLAGPTFRAVDSVGGMILSLGVFVVVAALVGNVMARAVEPSVRTEASESGVLAALGPVRQQTDRWIRPVIPLLEDSGLIVTPGRGQSATPPSSAAAPAKEGTTASTVNPADSTMKIVGLAPSCMRRQEGSGFVFAPDRVLTNAHVVEGVTRLSVTSRLGDSYRARVVVFDPLDDIAVLYVPGLRSAPLPFGGDIDAGTTITVAGYPQSGGYTEAAGRVRLEMTVGATAIDGHTPVRRSIYVLSAPVLPGNSGGPVFTADKRVVGMVYARSVGAGAGDGFAMTTAQVAGEAAAGRVRTAAVSTGRCY